MGIREAVLAWPSAWRRPSHRMDETGASEVVQNEAFDEAVDLSESDSVESPDEDEDQSEMSQEDEEEKSENDLVMNRSFDEAIELSPSASSVSGAQSHKNSPPVAQEEDSSSDSDEDEDDDGEAESPDPDKTGSPEATGVGKIEDGYDPAEFEDMECSEEIRELFSYITRYSAHNIELDQILRPFIPDFIPAVGDIDAFLKIPRPDGKVDDLGLTHLAEATLIQSDATIIEMELRAQTKKADLGAQKVSSIANAQANVPQIKKWIQSVDELHSSKPATEVLYQQPMPDIEALMQVWPAQFEEELERTPLPPSNIDVSLEEYAKIICAIFGVPVKDNVIPSLHVLFTLFSEFNQNQHFNREMDQRSPGSQSGNGMEMTDGVPMMGMTVVGQQMPLSPNQQMQQQMQQLSPMYNQQQQQGGMGGYEQQAYEQQQSAYGGAVGMREEFGQPNSSLIARPNTMARAQAHQDYAYANAVGQREQLEP